MNEYGVEKGKVYPYSEARGLLNPLRRLIVSPRELIQWMMLKPGARVLELGCGPGYFSPTLSKAVAPEGIVLFDLQREMLMMASERCRKQDVKSAAAQGSARHLPFSDSSFDCALMVTVLGETGNPVHAMKEIRRVLAPGGRLIDVEQRGDSDYIGESQIRQFAADAEFDVRRVRHGRFGLCSFYELAH